jgi:serine O-acetyltransferase
MAADDSIDRRAFMRAVRDRFPGFREAVRADARANAYYRGERYVFRSRLDLVVQIVRLCVQSDAFLAQVLYRAKASMQRRGIPLLPRVAHKLAMSTAQVSIGDPVIVAGGLYLMHGQIVIDGNVEVGPGAVIAPWVTIGLRAGDVHGATIGDSVHIGTGAKVVGPVTIGEGAHIGANAVVVDDVAEGTTVVGAPARPTVTSTSGEDRGAAGD